MNEHQKVREAVAKSYANAVSGNPNVSCCSQSAGCCAQQAQKGELVKLANYGQKELAVLPPDAVVNSFGCGNPVAFCGVKEGDVVLDLGSGAGIDVLIAAGKVGPTGRVTALIDKATGDIVWILGDPTGWPEEYHDLLLRPADDMRWFYQQHAPVITPDGTLLLFDNGNFGAFPPNPAVPLRSTFTRAVEYAIDEKAKTVRQVWESERLGDDGLVISLAMGEADHQPATGNVLLCYGACTRHGVPELSYTSLRFVNSWTMVREFSHTDPSRVVWEFVIGDPDSDSTAEVGWSAYGAIRLGDLSP